MIGGRYLKKIPDGVLYLASALNAGQAITIESVNVKGKFMWWELLAGSDKIYAHITYGMSGQWHVTPDPTQFKHRAITFAIGTDNSNFLVFNDPRRFGTIKFTDDVKEHDKKLASIGPDVYDLYAASGVGIFIDRLRKHSNKTLAEVLMNQHVISGIGNYVKAECLYAARLSPHRIVSTLSDSELDELFYATATVMIDSFNAGGASLRTYKNPSGTHGDFVFSLKVYGKATDPEGHQVTREETNDGRTTWWSHQVQK